METPIAQREIAQREIALTLAVQRFGQVPSLI